MYGDQPVRILVIEDYPADVFLVRRLLAKVKGIRFEIEEADRLTLGLERLAVGGIDLVLLDLGLPDSRGLDTLAKVRAHSPQVPIIVFTGFDDQQRGIKAISMGARDYLVKGVVDSELLGRAVLKQVGRERNRKDFGATA